MDRIRRAKPSPAMVVALISLFVALSGVAWAANTVGSADVIDNSLLSQDLKDGAAVKSADVVNDSLTGADIAESSLGKVPNADKLDGIDSEGFVRSLWAVAGMGTPTVGNPTGFQLFGGHGATGVERLGSGIFSVTFTRNILTCAYVASAGDMHDGAAPPQLASVQQRDATSNPNDVVVRTFTSGSTSPSDPALDDGFHLAVFC
jgi:hypothetical protein